MRSVFSSPALIRQVNNMCTETSVSKVTKHLRKCCAKSQQCEVLHMYSGGQLRWTGKNVSFCAPATTEIMKTNNVPLKTPIKLLPEMKKKI